MREEWDKKRKTHRKMARKGEKEEQGREMSEKNWHNYMRRTVNEDHLRKVGNKTRKPTNWKNLYCTRLQRIFGVPFFEGSRHKKNVKKVTPWKTPFKTTPKGLKGGKRTKWGMRKEEKTWEKNRVEERETGTYKNERRNKETEQEE